MWRSKFSLFLLLACEIQIIITLDIEMIREYYEKPCISHGGSIMLCLSLPSQYFEHQRVSRAFKYVH